MQRTAGNQATMRALAAGASPTPPADGEEPKKPPTATDGDDDDEPKLKPSSRAPGADDPSFTNSTGAPGPGAGPDRPRG